MEIGYQQFYDFLPGWLSGLGLQANYTYVDSKTKDNTLNQEVPLQNLSRNSYNVVLMYEKGPVSGRLAYNWRDKFLSAVGYYAGIGGVPTYVKAYGWLDASLTYRWNDKVSFSLEGLNLTRTVRQSYWGVESRPNMRGLEVEVPPADHVRVSPPAATHEKQSVSKVVRETGIGIEVAIPEDH